MTRNQERSAIGNPRHSPSPIPAHSNSKINKLSTRQKACKSHIAGNDIGNRANLTQKETHMANHVQKMFSIHDQKGEIFHPPFFKNTPGEAERDFRTAVKDPSSNLNKYPEDFNLYYVGDYDTQTGKITPLNAPVHMLHAVALNQ